MVKHIKKHILTGEKMTERSEIKRDKAVKQKNSGRGQYQKGDAKWYNFVVDYKETKSSFSLNKSVWAKICTDTFKVNRDMHPLLKIIIGEKDKTRLAIVEWSVLEDLVKFKEERDV
ncbi:MAG: hypothetical protein RLZZ195_266 [Pseudomonadota bacterium]|jgi:hypothetical protein